MKRLLIFLMFTAIALAGAAAQQQTTAQLSFTFTRQSGAASNQFAVWIEDAQGNYVKTLYATSYTATGGYQKRETSIPVWVRKSGLAALTRQQVNALTGATPGSGTVTYTWDGTDWRGAAAAAGIYEICLEGTVRWENRVMYRAPIRIGQGPQTAQAAVEYTGNPPGNERSMIANVTVRVLR